MKILWENEQVDIIEAGTNEVVFTTSLLDENYDPSDDDVDDEEEEEGDVSAFPLLTYKIKMYKNNQSQQPDRTVKVKAANMYVQAINETSSILYLINHQKQAVYCTAWELVHSVDSEEA